MRIKNILFLIISLYSVTALASENGPIKWGCDKPGLLFHDDEEECDLYVIDNGRRYFITTISGDRGINHTSVKYHTKDLAEISTSIGSGYAPSFFYQISTKRTSTVFDQVAAIDPINKLVIEVGMDGTILKSIFEDKHPINQVLVPYEEISSNSAIPLDNMNAEFKDNRIYLGYEDNDEKAQKKVFDIKDFIK